MTTELLGLDREPDSDLPLGEQFRFDAGSVALNLLATRGFRRSDSPVERLTSTERLQEWLAASGLPDVAVTASDLARLQRLREDGYAVLRALVDGQHPPRGPVTALGEVAARPIGGRSLRVDGPAVRWHEAGATFETLLITLARDLAATAVGPVPLSACLARDCGMIFRDASRGRRRQWCSMSRCGNAAKARRHRDRQRGDD